jgi:homoserine dehydrogenase
MDCQTIQCQWGVGKSSSSLGIGLAGFGTVGSGVWNTLQRNGELITDRTGGGISLHIAKILVRDPAKARANTGEVPAEIFTTNWKTLVEDPAVDIVVELIGGTSDAFDIVAAALRAKKPVVTGNKALLAERGVELFAISREMDTPIHFEAAVAGGIPIIRTVQDSFIGNRIHSFSGIINGTSNYILGRMTDVGLTFEAALAEAQALGYAEADPALDVNGWDAAHKAILLATLAYGFPIHPASVHVSGIEQVRPTDITFAKNLGYAVKLLAVIREHSDGAVELRIQPSFIAQTNILASVHGVFNAVAVHGDAAGESLFYGRGAGQDPTASSVVADLVEAARSLGHVSGHRGFLPYIHRLLCEIRRDGSPGSGGGDRTGPCQSPHRHFRHPFACESEQPGCRVCGHGFPAAHLSIREVTSRTNGNRGARLHQ